MVSQVEFQFCPFCGKNVKNASEWVQDGKIFETRWLCENKCEASGYRDWETNNKDEERDYKRQQ